MTVVAYLGITFFTQPLERQDQVASVVAMLLAIVVFSLDFIRRRRAENRDAATPADRRAISSLEKLTARTGGATPTVGLAPATPSGLRVHPAIDLEDDSEELATRPLSWANRLAFLFFESNSTTPSSLDAYLPNFIKRDVELSIDEWAAKAKTEGGFLLLVGNSSVGKTRLLYELTLRHFKSFQIVQPNPGDASPINDLANSEIALESTIIWVDELHRYLPGRYVGGQETPLQASAVSRLLDDPSPVVFLGSCWPSHLYYFLSTTSDQQGNASPLNPTAYEIIRSSRLREIRLDSFNESERSRAIIEAARDPRVAKALESPSYNVTEALSGAPRVMALYSGSTDAAHALLPAAIDCRRAGFRSGLTETLIRAAAVGFTRNTNEIDNWFSDAWALCTTRDRGAAALVELPVSGDCEPQFEIFDYLMQKASAARRTSVIPDAVWEALSDKCQNLSDLRNIGRAAAARWRFDVGRRLTPKLAQLGDRSAQIELIGNVLADDESSLKILAGSGDLFAAEKLFALLEAKGRFSESEDYLRMLALADRGAFLDDYLRLAERFDDIPTLWDILHDGSSPGSIDIARSLDLSAQRKILDVIVKIAERTKQTTDLDRAREAAKSLREGTVLDDRTDWKSQRPESDVSHLIGRSDSELQALAETGDSVAAEALLDRLESNNSLGYIDQLREWAESDTFQTKIRLIDHLVQTSNILELQRWADRGDSDATGALADILADSGDLAGLNDAALSGNWVAQGYLGMIDDQKELSALIGDELARSVYSPARVQKNEYQTLKPTQNLMIESLKSRHGATLDSLERYVHSKKASEFRSYSDSEQGFSNLATWLYENVDEKGLSMVAETGDPDGIDAYALYLANTERLDQSIELLARHIASGDDYKTVATAVRLAREADRSNTPSVEQLLNALQARGDAGDDDCLRATVDLLHEWKDLRGLRGELAAGNPMAGDPLARLLSEEGMVEESVALRAYGVGPAGKTGLQLNDRPSVDVRAWLSAVRQEGE